jgi:hypothetical protein
MKPDFKNILSDSSRLTIDVAVKAVDANPANFNELMSLCMSPDSVMNMRASRVASFVSDKYPNLFLPYVNKIAEAFSGFKTDGQKRAFAYILSKYTTSLNEENQSEMLDICFKYMLSNEKVAVKYNCMRFLFAMTRMYPELKGELKAAIDFNITEEVFRMNGEIKKVYKAIEKL